MKPSRRRQQHARSRFLQAPAFSLVELVLVVTIIGIIAGIAVPRISSAAATANANALDATLTNVRQSIDIYYAEHGSFPGYVPGTQTPDGSHFVNQLTLYSDADGNSNATKSAQYKFGPYLRAPFPTNPANQLATVHVKADASQADPADGTVGWVAVLSTGDFGVSATNTQLVDIGVKDVVKMDLLRLR